MNCNMLTNEQLLEKAVLSFETLEYRDETLDRLRAERDALLAEADLRINAETSHRKETEAEHQEVMQELARRMIAHQVKTIRDWRGTFRLEEVADGVTPMAQFVQSDGGQISWVDWIAMDSAPETPNPATVLPLNNVA